MIMAIYEKETFHTNPEKTATISAERPTVSVVIDGVTEAGWEPVGHSNDETGRLVVELEKDGNRINILADDLDVMQSDERAKVPMPIARDLGEKALDVAFKIPESSDHERTRINVIDPGAGKTYDIDVSHPKH